MIQTTPAIFAPRATPIQWPNSPVLETLWTVAKNYILTPAMSASAGLLTGGPTGTAVAKATYLAHQIVTDLVLSQQKKKTR